MQISYDKAIRKRFEDEMINDLRAHDFESAVIRILTFRGDIERLNKKQFQDEINILNDIFTKKPKILKSLDDSNINEFRILAGMAFLWQNFRVKKTWIPVGLETGIHMDTSAVARMFVRYAEHLKSLPDYRDSTVLKGVEILSPNDARSCPICQKVSGTLFPLDQIPELPYEHCISDEGCRCCLIPTMLI